MCKIHGPRHVKTCLRAYADSEGPETLAHPRSLMRALAVRTYNHHMLLDVSMEIKCPDQTMHVQDDVNPHNSHMLGATFFVWRGPHYYYRNVRRLYHVNRLFLKHRVRRARNILDQVLCLQLPTHGFFFLRVGRSAYFFSAKRKTSPNTTISYIKFYTLLQRFQNSAEGGVAPARAKVTGRGY